MGVTKAYGRGGSPLGGSVKIETFFFFVFIPLVHYFAWQVMLDRFDF